MGLAIEDGALRGDWQQPINRWMDSKQSIHNDDTAKKVGMRGGTIPGTVHLPHFTPLIKELWGRRWFEQGSISMFYTYASTHKEDVRAVVKVPEARSDDEQLDACVEMKDGGHIVVKGTLSVGNPDAVGYVRGIQHQNAPRDELRILSEIQPGTELTPRENVTAPEGSGDTGEYEGIVTNPATLTNMLRCGMPKGIKRGVGFFGATEVRILKGPVTTSDTYRVTGRVVSVEVSPRTESFWLDTELRNPETDEIVADMRFLHRWMKAASPEYDQ